MNNLRTLSTVVIVLVFQFSSILRAQEEASQPAEEVETVSEAEATPVAPPPPVAEQPAAQPAAPTTEQPTGKLTVTVIAVKGLVSVRKNAEEPWTKANVGMVLGEGAEFRTGPRSAVQFKIPPEQTITLDRLGTIKVLQAIKDAKGKVSTDVGMKYGRTRWKIEAAGTEHECKVHNPSATLAVRGTGFGNHVDAFSSVAWSNEHVVRISSTLLNRQVISVGSATPQGTSFVDAGDRSSGQKNKRDGTGEAATQFDVAGPEAEMEQNLQAYGGDYLRSEGLLDLLDRTELQGGTIIGFGGNDFATLTVALQFFGTVNVTDLNLSVANTVGELVTATSGVSLNGGMHSGDQIAMPFGNFGVGNERATWVQDVPFVGAGPPSADYMALIDNVSPDGDPDASFNLVVDLDDNMGGSMRLVNIAGRSLEAGNSTAEPFTVP